MPPNYQAQPQMTPIVPGQAPKKRWPFSKKVTIIGAVVVVVVVLIIILMQPSPTQKTTSNNSGNIANSLVQTSLNKTVNYGGVPVVQPCTVLSLKDISEAGLKISEDESATITRTYLDGVGQALQPVDTNNTALPFEHDSNNCKYTLTNNDHIVVTIFQPSYINMGAVRHNVARDTPQPDIQGVKVFKYPPAVERLDQFMLTSGDSLAAEIMLTGLSASDETKILTVIAGRLANPESATNLTKFEYKNPLVQSPILNACDLTDNASFKIVAGVDAGPLVHEEVSHSLNRIVLSAKDTYNYGESTCSRRTAGESLQSKQMTVLSRTFATDAAAAAYFAADLSSKFTATPKPTPTKIGDESYYGNFSLGLNKAIGMRKGRFLVYASFGVFASKGPSVPDIPSQSIATLTPLMQQILANKLKGF